MRLKHQYRWKIYPCIEKIKKICFLAKPENTLPVWLLSFEMQKEILQKSQTHQNLVDLAYRMTSKRGEAKKISWNPYILLFTVDYQ